MQIRAYNKEQLETVITDIRNKFDSLKSLNITYEKASKEKTKAQVHFTFGGVISQITDYFQECGFNVDKEDVRYKLYEDVSKIVPEMVVDRQIFCGKPRIKHIPEMDRELLSKFINGIFSVLDSNPIYEGVRLSPDVFYNFIFHLDPEDIKQAQTVELPERDSEYLEYIRSLPCICCGKQHRSEAHHIRDTRTAGVSIKSPDWYTLPLCRDCHLGIAHGTGWKEAMKWVPIDLIDFCRLNYIKWGHKK